MSHSEMPPKRRGRGAKRWQGIVLCVAALVATVWLGISNQLILYIHPRYIVFTVIMAVLGLVLVIASFGAPADDHDHEHVDDEKPPPGWRRLITIGASALTAIVAIALVIVPPATLTTATADQRVINSTAVGSVSKSVSSATSATAAATARFTVADWSSLLRQTTDASFYQGKAANVTGFISEDKNDPTNTFYVTRFVITCCAVDAQPVGVPVYLPDWKSSFASGGWVIIKGSFASNPSRSSDEAVALIPTSTTKTAQPSDPYLY